MLFAAALPAGGTAPRRAPMPHRAVTRGPPTARPGRTGPPVPGPAPLPPRSHPPPVPPNSASARSAAGREALRGPGRTRPLSPSLRAVAEIGGRPRGHGPVVPGRCPGDPRGSKRAGRQGLALARHRRLGRGRHRSRLGGRQGRGPRHGRHLRLLDAGGAAPPQRRGPGRTQAVIDAIAGGDLARGIELTTPEIAERLSIVGTPKECLGKIRREIAPQWRQPRDLRPHRPQPRQGLHRPRPGRRRRRERSAPPHPRTDHARLRLSPGARAARAVGSLVARRYEEDRGPRAPTRSPPGGSGR